MKRIAALLILALSQLAHAEPYKEYSQEQLQAIFGVEDEKGKYNVNLNDAELVAITTELEQHAINYPVQFDRPEDQSLAVRDAVYLSNVMDILFPSFESDLPLLSLTVRINNVAYNLDAQPELANQRLLKAADAIFKLDPNNVETHYRLGFFLASSNRVELAIPHLEEAANNGIVNANYSLGMVYLSLENLPKALEYLSIYKENAPNDTSIDSLIEEIKSGNLKIEKKQSPNIK